MWSDSEWSEWFIEVLTGDRNKLWEDSYGLLQEGSAASLNQLETSLVTWGNWIGVDARWQHFDNRRVAKEQTEGMRWALLGAVSALKFPADPTGCLSEVWKSCQSFGRSLDVKLVDDFPPVSLREPSLERLLREAFEAWEQQVATEALEALAMARLTVHEAFRAFKGRAGLFDVEAGESIVSREIHTSILMTIANTGTIKRLKLGWVDRGAGPSQLVANPITMGATAIDSSFRTALDSAWHYARAQVPEGVWIVWSIDGLRQEKGLKGGSAGAAFAVALLALCQNKSLNFSIAVSAAVDHQGQLSRVEGVRYKLVAANRENLRLCLFSVDQDADDLAQLPVSIRQVSTVDECLEIMAGSIEEWTIYLKRLIEFWNRATSLNGWLNQSFFEKLHVAMRVGFLRNESASNADLAPSGKNVPLLWHDDKNVGSSARIEHPWAVVLGPPGLGKSILLKYEAWLTLSEQLEKLKAPGRGISDLILPVYAHVPSLIDATRGGNTLIPALIDLLTNSRYHGLHLPDSVRLLIETKLQRGDVVLLLDGLEQASREEYNGLMGLISGWNGAGSPRRVVMTSRVSGFSDLPLRMLPHSPTILELIPLTRSEVADFIDAHLGDDAGPRLKDHVMKDDGLFGLAQSPLTLRLLCQTANTPGSVHNGPPATRSALYRDCLDGFLNQGVDDPESIMHKLSIGHWKTLLYSLTWALFADNPARIWFSLEDLGRELRAVGTEDLTRLETGVPAAAAWLIEKVGIFTDKSLDLALNDTHDNQANLTNQRPAIDRYCFLHKTFQEYLLACELVRRNQNDTFPEAIEPIRLYNPGWSEVLVLMAGVLARRDHLEPGNRTATYLQALLSQNRDDLMQRPLLLTCRALGETNRFPQLNAKIADLVISLYLDPPPFLDPALLLQPIARLGQPAIDLLRAEHDRLTAMVSELLPLADETVDLLKRRSAIKAVLIQLGVVPPVSGRSDPQPRTTPPPPDRKALDWGEQERKLTAQFLDTNLSASGRARGLRPIVAAYAEASGEISESLKTALLAALSSDSATFRAWATDSMVEFRHPPRWLIERLLERLDAEQDRVALSSVADALGRLAHGDAAVITGLWRALAQVQVTSEPIPGIAQFKIARALARAGPSLTRDQRGVIRSILIRSLQAKTPVVRRPAVAAIRWLSQVDDGPIAATDAPAEIQYHHQKIQVKLDLILNDERLWR